MKRRTLLRMVLAYLIFGLIGFVTISTFTSNNNERSIEKQEAAALRRECTSIASTYSASYSDNSITLAEYQKELANIAAYLNVDIYVINTKGRILVNSLAYADPGETETIDAFDILDFGNGSYNVGTFYDHYTEDVLSVYTTLASNYQTKTYIVICEPLSVISDKQYDLLDSFYLTMIILYCLSLLILMVYIFSVHLPLRKITKAAQSYADGDFTAAIQLEREDEFGYLADTMNYMAQELGSLEEDQRKFISNISHDFRSPLTSIKGYAQAIADGVIPVEMQDKYLNIIVFETERLEKLTQSLLELNKFGSRGMYLDIREFDINKLIKQTVLSFEGLCKEKMLKIHLLLTGDSMYVKADSAKIDRVIHNLLDNAVKFSHDNSVIKIETTIKGEKLFISVKDSGIGIPKDAQKKIWERFYKTDLSRGKDKKGTGLGLSIVREIILAHRENINVISTEGVGTEFIFSLPLGKQPDQAQ